MKTTRLKYPVHTVDGRPLLPAGALLTDETLDELIRSDKDSSYPAASLLDFGTVRRDLLLFMRQGCYRAIFDDPRRTAALLRLMEKVTLVRPALDALQRFQRHDLYTYRHVLMVFALSVLLARDLEEQWQEMILEATAGPLHDIGKICIPAHIRKKTTPLSRAERDHLEHHTLAGYVLLAYYLKDARKLAAKVAAEHHERKDGTGYPRGIPLGDRLVEIVVACDVYDALISPRPYRRESYDNRTALEVMTEMASRGKIDWAVVKALVAFNRKDKPASGEVSISLEKRGKAPKGNLYGVFADDPSPKTIVN